jgi:alpha-beta hydrolase superfamily lysophospholipase
MSYTRIDFSSITTDGSVGDIVIAIRGTQLSDSGDLVADGRIAAGQTPDQYYDAMAFYSAVKAENPNADISLTGHSLGGALASLVAAKTGEEATVRGAEGGGA